MTNEEKLKANIAAAKLLGLSPAETPQGGVRYYHYSRWEYFELFENPSDCLDVVIKLGEDYDISLYYKDNMWMAGVHDIPYVREEWFTKLFDTYQKAVAAAVLEVVKDE